MFRNSGRWLRWLAVIALAGVALVEFLHWEIGEQRRQDQYQRLVQVGADVRAQMEARLSSALFLSTGLVTYIESQKGDIDGGEMTRWLSRMLEQDEAILNIGVAPDNRIQYLYPLQGNEAAMGLYYPDLPEQWPEVQAVMDSGKPVLAGPVSLVQGGRGLVYRAPVFVDGQYWGLVSTVMDAPVVFRILEQASQNQNVDIQLYRLRGGEPEVLWGEPVDLERTQYTSVITVPGATWRLRFQPRDGDMFTWLFRLSAYSLLAVMVALVGVAIRAWLKQQGQERALREESERLKETLVSTVSQEVRTPLNNILNALSLLVKGKEGELQPTTRQMIELAHRNAEWVLTRVDELAKYEWAGAGIVDYQPASHRMTDLVEEAMHALSGMAETRGVVLVAGQIEPEVRCVLDARRFRQAMTTVMTNAIEASPAGTQVEVSVRQYGQWCEVSIRDQGPGLPDATRRRLSRWFRSRSDDAGDSNGHGMKLSVIKALIEGMGGTLTYVSKKTGTVFRISFPTDAAVESPVA
ncbi:sensor histidine kinase [Saccharospirillum salsuginis]|uniref:histidine kinase n=1 Tax=Saccharospirillum salsuginis TaxID=418750 RepID=A0A918K1W6_9GAMM|nr:ATP-binding protein [Saccharospirillum salsuginis]GGX43799.1 hypothetical protein GCM10007392_08190 [Saccharospirillum salsuginis]